MENLKPNEFERELDKTLSDLELDLKQAKHTDPTGTTYQFLWDGLPFYICIPNQIPNSYSHVLRFEIEVCELDEADAGLMMYSISLYLAINDCSLVRVAPKPTKGQKVKIMLQIVGVVDWFHYKFAGQAIIHMADLGTYFHETMIEDNQKKAA